MQLPVLSSEGNLAIYLQEIKKFPILTAEEEYMLAKRYKEHGDTEAAHKLVTSHLRLVAKIAMGYRGYGLPVTDLISEGNVGIMQAVKKFDPERGFRLATYAMWWIRAQIQEYVLHSWSLVKIGTTAAQKKLFFNLKKLKNQLSSIDSGDLSPENAREIATRLNVKEGEVLDMNNRLFSGDQSLNVQVGDELTVIYTSGNGVDALATVQSIVSSTQFIVNIPNPQNTSTSGNCTFYPTHKTGCGFFYSGACLFTGDTWHLNPETFDLFYKLKVAGPPSYYRNAMRFDHRMSIEYDQVSGGELANNDIHYGTASNPEANKSAMMSNNGSSGHRAMIFESDAFFKSIDNSTDSDFTPGSHGRSDTPLKNIARHDSGSETMGLVKDGVLILNTDGTLKIKMGREGTSNARLLLFKDGAGSATIFHNNTANSETTISANLTAGTYTLNWQLYVLSSWGFPGVTDATAPKVKITSEPT